MTPEILFLMMVIGILITFVKIIIIIAIKSWALALGDRLSVTQSASVGGKKGRIAGSVN